jgi:hypothetical protein
VKTLVGKLYLLVFVCKQWGESELRWGMRNSVQRRTFAVRSLSYNSCSCPQRRARKKIIERFCISTFHDHHVPVAAVANSKSHNLLVSGSMRSGSHQYSSMPASVPGRHECLTTNSFDYLLLSPNPDLAEAVWRRLLKHHHMSPISAIAASSSADMVAEDIVGRSGNFEPLACLDGAFASASAIKASRSSHSWSAGLPALP